MNLLLATAIVALSVLVSVAIFLALRRRAPAGGRFSDGDRAAGVLGLLTTGFAILLGFIVFLAFESYDSAQNGARDEATYVIQQFETAQLLPQPAAARLSGELVCYGRAVVGIEWPALRHGHKPSFNPWGLALFQTFEKIDPRTAAQQAAYSHWLDQTTAREQARLDRLQAGRGVIPAPLWLIVFALGAFVFGYALLFADPAESVIAQAATAAAIAGTLAASLVVIRFLDDPYSPGVGSLKPTDMVRVLGQIDQATRALGIVVHLPCAASGRPT